MSGAAISTKSLFIFQPRLADFGSQVAQADVRPVGWMALFSSTVAIAERWTGEASSTLRKAAPATQLPKSTDLG